MRKSIAFLAILSVIILCGRTECQEQAMTKFLAPIGNSTADRGVEERGSAVEINASKDTSNATIKWGHAFSSSESQKWFAFYTFNLTASAPINKEKDATELASTLDGFANSFSMGAKVTKLWMSGVKRNNPVYSPLLDRICAELTVAYRDKTKKTDEPVCDTDQVKTYLPESYVGFKSLFWDEGGWRFALGIEPKVGYKKFKFLEADTIKEVSDSEIPWGVKVFGAFAPPKWSTLFTVGYEYQDGFKDADSGTLCPPGDGVIQCKTGAVGKPQEKETKLVYAEVRRRLRERAVSLKLSYDLEEDMLGADLPIHLVKDDKGNLTGGIRFGWTEKDHWQAGVFVGSAFSLF